MSAAVILAAITLFGSLLDLRVAPTNLAMLYLSGVVVISYRWGLGPALVSSLVSAFTFDFFFIPPFESFAITDTWYLITALTFMCAAVLISFLTTAVRQHALVATRREAHTAALYGLTQSLAAAGRPQDVIEAATKHIKTAFGFEVAILPTTVSGKLATQVDLPGTSVGGYGLAEIEKVLVAARNGTVQPRGAFLPLRTADEIVGLIILPPAQVERRPSSIVDDLVLEAIAAQVAIAIKRAQLEDEAREAEVLRKADELQRTLLNSVSHSLRAPLAAILSAIHPIAGGDADTTAVAELARIAQAEACRLDTLIGNLLDMSRLEAGALKPRMEPHDIRDVIGAALHELRDVEGREIVSRIDARCPLVVIDFPLIVNALVNLFDNAIKYSSAGSVVDIEAMLVRGEVEIRVADRGCGVSAREREAIFRKFARGSTTEHTPGVGLGLPICKGFVEAHGGRIWVEERPGGGSIFCLTLPTFAARDQGSLPSGGVQRRTSGTES